MFGGCFSGRCRVVVYMYSETHNPSRRRLVCCGVAAMAGLFSRPARSAPWASSCAEVLSPAARDLLARCLAGLDASQLWDMHCHLLGNGDSGSGCWLHPSLSGGWNLLERARKRVILDAACVDSGAPSIDHAFVQRLLALVAGFPGGARFLLLAFDQTHDDQGRPDRERTTLFVPNAYAQSLAQSHPDRLVWAASIHPYREDALQALQAAQAAGARAVKWLPSAMNIDLRDARSRRFAALSGRLNLPLIVHCGEEKAVPGAGRDELANPLHVRSLLEQGARVVVAHCASLGEALDVDQASAPVAHAFDLFARLMNEREFEGRLFGDISAVFQSNRRPAVWQQLLRSPHWHARLLHGSDHPLPGLKPLVRLSKLHAAGLVAEADRAPLETLRDHNPLLFDLALKRCLRLGSQQLAASVFETRSHFR